ncbi:hypothetical protein E3T43_07385 [Cryobacterium sp. Hh7]|uniref:hypothetical protein n=1 Tax=Cryobacterium sp. Hh7 TaxID=1259159 RepID=UPI00106ABE5F|nr:hypothetical protein [Cryobacterium sp. Hh7]TFD58060.1 hypothetical protein E3T43_07385 [Cryobacterium sp. Hh7]
MTPWEIFGMVAASVGLVFVIIAVALILGRIFYRPEPERLPKSPTWTETRTFPQSQASLDKRAEMKRGDE